MATITIIDESTLGERYTRALDLLEESLPLRELIRRRVYQDVTEYNAGQTGATRGLVRPGATERALNGPQSGAFKPLSWEAHYEITIEAFARRGFIVLVDDRQISDLDASIQLSAGSEVTFLRLVPLVGG